jgi:endonuclease III
MATQQALLEPLHEKIHTVYELLLAQQGERPNLPRREPMRELISTMLSHRTTHRNEELAYNQMWERFGSWEGIRDAPVDELTAALQPATFPEVKAPNIKATLVIIIAERGRAEIDFLADLPPAEGMAWLMKLPGVGVKTASLVLLFCFGKPVLPVDVHVHRVSQRLGLIGKKVDATAAHPLLQAMLPQEAHVLYNFHVAMLRHGQRICVWNTPKCEECVLKAHCDYYATVRAGRV